MFGDSIIIVCFVFILLQVSSSTYHLARGVSQSSFERKLAKNLKKNLQLVSNRGFLHRSRVLNIDEFTCLVPCNLSLCRRDTYRASGEVLISS